MVDTSWAVRADKQWRVPPDNRRVDGALQQQPPATIPSAPTPPFRGDGGLYSTARDYGLFMRMPLNGGPHAERVRANRLRECELRRVGS